MEKKKNIKGVREDELLKNESFVVCNLTMKKKNIMGKKKNIMGMSKRFLVCNLIHVLIIMNDNWSIRKTTTSDGILQLIQHQHRS